MNAVAVTPDGKYILSGSSDMTLRLGCLETGEFNQSFQGHSGEVSAVSVTPDGQSMVSGGQDNNLMLWSLQRGKCMRVFQGHSDYVNALAITSDGQFVISGSSDCTLRLWEINTGRCLRVFERNPACLDMYYGKNNLLRGSNSEFSYNDVLCDLAIAKTYDEANFTLLGHADQVNAVAVTPDGKFVVSGSNDATFRLWNLTTGKCLWIFGGHGWEGKFGVQTAAVTPNGRFALSGSEALRMWKLSNKRLRRWLWGIMDERPLQTIKEHRGGIDAIAITPDGGYMVAAGYMDNTLRLYKLNAGRCRKVFKGHTGYINAVAVTPDGRFAVSGSRDCTLRVWDLGYKSHFFRKY